MTAPNLTDAHRHAIAVRESARAVLLSQLDPNTSVLQVSIVPTQHALGFTQTVPAAQVVSTTAEMENRITALLAGTAAVALHHEDAGGPDSSAEYARHLAEELADNQVFDWRRSDPERAQTIVARCFERAKALVKANEARIEKLADMLLQRGSVTGGELASI
ncbi:MAG: hypothetical protein JSS83_27680 [Cyanobacteria bacterium SZAS LIN-3]|nr:hypothetical protein [Cyanobacteria bacterium SZAS LIN-3]MBS2007374.1 hypothetical protein [Cyanobacteria bacterium SZAS TMP-1]